jgi:hypothetical protein
MIFKDLKKRISSSGIPLSVLITAANTHDMKSAANTLDNIMIVKRRRGRILASSNTIQNLCLDKGYDYPEIETESIKKEDTQGRRDAIGNY